ncbi:MAG: hypothetical protein WDZ62_00745 [Candidatus Pacearchaeota archaeon]
MEVNKGDVVKINGEKYDVCEFFPDIDDVHGDDLVGEHSYFGLVKQGSGKIQPTHFLKIYNGKKVFGKIVKEEFVDGNEITSKNVKVIK